MEVSFSDKKTKALHQHLRDKMKYERTGFHLSDAIFCNHKPLLRERFNLNASNDQIALFATGHAFQYWLSPVSQEDSRVYEVDGVQMTPDFTNTYFAQVHIKLAEFKSTRSSLRKFTEKDMRDISHHYVQQKMGYCKALETQESDLIILFLMGDYRPPFPIFKVWEYKFTQDEIDTWWTEVLRRKEIFNRAVRDGSLPEEHIMVGKWECNYCECTSVCPIYEDKLLNGNRMNG